MDRRGRQDHSHSLRHLLWTFKRLYPTVAGEDHCIQVFTPLRWRTPSSKKQAATDHARAMKVTYHDPCHLGRQGEDYVPWDGEETKIFGQAVSTIRPARYNGAFGATSRREMC